VKDAKARKWIDVQNQPTLGAVMSGKLEPMGSLTGIQVQSALLAATPRRRCTTANPGVSDAPRSRSNFIPISAGNCALPIPTIVRSSLPVALRC